MPSRLGESMWVDDDRLYVIGPGANRAGPGVRIITAYPLPDGLIDE